MASDYTAMKNEVEDEPESWTAGFIEPKNEMKLWYFLFVLDLTITFITAIAYFSSTGDAKPEPIPADYGEFIPSCEGPRNLTYEVSNTRRNHS